MSIHPCEIILFNEKGRKLPGIPGSPDEFNPHSCGQDAVILVDDVKSTPPYWCCYRHLPTDYKRILRLQVLRDLLSTLATEYLSTLPSEHQLGDGVAGRTIEPLDIRKVLDVSPEEFWTGKVPTDERLLDVVYDILQANLAYLNQGKKGTHLEHEDHEAYFQQHVKLLRDLLAEAHQ
jgi:hypothetical protein